MAQKPSDPESPVPTYLQIAGLVVLFGGVISLLLVMAGSADLYSFKTQRSLMICGAGAVIGLLILLAGAFLEKPTR